MHSSEPQEEVFDPYVEGNKRILALETEEIELVIKRHHWNMQETGTGLYYELLSPGTGECFVEGDSVAMKYTIALLSGNVIYDSETDGVKTFRVEKSEEIPALHEVAKLVSPGAKVRMVVPSHLAYGAGGDGNKIKGREAWRRSSVCQSWLFQDTTPTQYQLVSIPAGLSGHTALLFLQN